MTELPLFSLPSTTTNTDSDKTTEEKLIQPLTEVLNAPSNSSKPPENIKKSLDDLFPEQVYEEKQLKKAKEILGNIANEFTSEQLRDAITEIQFLATSWLDDFERGIFDGLTLQELLHEKGGA